MDYKSLQIENFFRYLAISSQSNAKNKALPSSKGQYELALLLKKECQSLGLVDINLNENAILTAKLKGNSDKKSVGFLTHLDTVDVGLSESIRPQILKFKGQDLVLNEKKNIIFKIKEHPEIKKYMNEDIIFSDGTSVLGADNKAALATVMSLLSFLVNEKPLHGDIFVAFVPDEEIGLRGSKLLNLEHFKPDFAYTIDACELGELATQTFNAAKAMIDIKGVSAHPMNAKGILLNPTLVAVDIINCLDRLQTPENTEDTQGYIWAQELHSNQSKASLLLNIRDHNKNDFEEKKAYLKEVITLIKKRHKRAKIRLKIEDLYHNIGENMNEENKQGLELLKLAFEKCELKPKLFAMRGGTDGAALKGRFVPNFFTGAHNFHSKFEFLPLSSFYKSFEVSKMIVNLA